MDLRRDEEGKMSILQEYAILRKGGERMLERILNKLAGLRTQMGPKSFWCVAVLCVFLGGILGYQFNDFLTTRYREPKWESERQAMETRIVKAESYADDLLNEKGQIARELETLKRKLDEHKTINDHALLAMSNQVLLAAMKNAQWETNSLNAQIATLKIELSSLREKYSSIPIHCTNSSLISIAYDLDEKMKLREGAIERNVDELKAIMVDILGGLQKEGQVQTVRLKLLPLSERQKKETEFVSHFFESVTLVGVFYSHFIKHIYQTADHIYYVNLLTPREVMALKYKAPFQCVEVARSLARKINAPDLPDQNMFKRASEIMEKHLNGCK